MGDNQQVQAAIQILLLPDGKVQLNGTVPNLYVLKGLLGLADDHFTRKLAEAGDKPKLAGAVAGLALPGLRAN